MPAKQNMMECLVCFTLTYVALKELILKGGLHQPIDLTSAVEELHSIQIGTRAVLLTLFSGNYNSFRDISDLLHPDWLSGTLIVI